MTTHVTIVNNVLKKDGQILKQDKKVVASDPQAPTNSKSLAPRDVHSDQF